ncbi:hypothetical protein LINPERHAP1_LOCUS37221 [Linum perenne]
MNIGIIVKSKQAINRSGFRKSSIQQPCNARESRERGDAVDNDNSGEEVGGCVLGKKDRATVFEEKAARGKHRNRGSCVGVMWIVDLAGHGWNTKAQLHKANCIQSSRR